MTLDEIEERVKHSLETLNEAEELYDWRITHFNDLAWLNVSEGCYQLSEGKLSENDLKSLIKVFRDRSEISYIDFHVKVPEPGVDDFQRMVILFGLKPGTRLLPPSNFDDRKTYLQKKILSAMRLTMENKHVVSEKIKQQYNWMMIREKTKTPEMLAVHLNLESYNPYQKKLTPAPAVTLTQHRGFEGTVEIAAPAPAPMFAPSRVDNSSFEARLAPAPAQATRKKARSHPSVPLPREIDRVTAVWEKEGAPHELPTEIHEEFAAYCQNLYEKAKGH
jgi:hypothetical protein